LALTSPTSSSLSVSIVRSWTQAREFVSVFLSAFEGVYQDAFMRPLGSIAIYGFNISLISEILIEIFMGPMYIYLSKYKYHFMFSSVEDISAK
jgi:hypothetical protein